MGEIEEGEGEGGGRGKGEGGRRGEGKGGRESSRRKCRGGGDCEQAVGGKGRGK